MTAALHFGSLPERVHAFLLLGPTRVYDLAMITHADPDHVAKALRSLAARGLARRTDGLPVHPGRGRCSIWEAA